VQRDRARRLREEARELRWALIVLALRLANAEEQLAILHEGLGSVDDVGSQCLSATAAEARGAAQRAERFAAHLRNDLLAEVLD
jgi:hypothetical protein